MIRVYVPAPLPQVIAWYDAGAIPAGTAIHSVTDTVRQQHPDADEEELEYLATVAARAEVLDGHPAVVAVDVPQPGARLLEDVPVARWAALFVDDLQWYAISEIDTLR